LARFGQYEGTRAFATEEEAGHALMDALSDGERQQATIGQDLPGELLTAAFQDNRRIEPAGIRYPDLPVKAANASKHCSASILGAFGGAMTRFAGPR
jgi:hypothetical protein